MCLLCYNVKLTNGWAIRQHDTLTLSEANMSLTNHTSSESQNQVFFRSGCIPEKFPPDIQVRDIDGFPGYKVGDDGSVWSCLGIQSLGNLGSRSVRTNQWYRLKGLSRKAKNRRVERGHLYVSLRRNSSSFHRYIHSLVLTAFRGPAPNGDQARHLDGNHWNNRLENLAWGTHSENARDSIRHGTFRNQKLNEQDVHEIRRRRECGETYSSIAKDYPVSIIQILCICKRKSWSHV